MCDQLRILFFGEKPVSSAPSLTLARRLNEMGFVSTFVARERPCGVRSWIRLFRQHHVIIHVAYNGPDLHSIRQLSVARSLGTPIVRWWVGTDVLNCLTDPETKRAALLLDRIVACNIAVAPHLVEELSTIGLKSRPIPSVVDSRGEWPQVGSKRLPKKVLVYLPTNRFEFYSGPAVEELIRRNSDIEFIIVADELNRFTEYPNVESPGWMDDLEPVWSRVGCLLRITRHDGMPRMVLDALRRRKHVIFSWPFPGCWCAQTLADIHDKLREFSQATADNSDGLEEFYAAFPKDPAEEFARVLKSTVTQAGQSARFKAAAICVHLMARERLYGKSDL